jgi:hypothetical protein
MNGPEMSHGMAPPASLQQVLDTQLSRRSRLGYVALLLVSLAMAGIVGSLWLTEPVLVARVQVGFALIVGIALAWSGFAIWTLATRRPLLGQDRVIAGRMAVTFTSIFAASAIALALADGRPASYGAAATGLVMLGAAAAVLARARRHVARLTARRQALERELGRGL